MLAGMPVLHRVDVVLSFSAPVAVEEVERLCADLELPLPRLATGEPDPGARDVRVDEDGEGADLVLLVEAETDVEAREAVVRAVTDALARGPWDDDAARVELVRSTAAYDLS
ncbi:hypothetical protein [uncultured Pseudokineococcus sp.]|uniref:hypothetical protein n=1 Tax=uncultured Pseudokineococcus sp. TaxID=1642928 RepID=UPI00262C8888|nr:hypothetical protein [uncultured Pseudokineococcus sp.]